MNTKLFRNNLFILLGYAVFVQLIALVDRNGASMMVLIFMMVAVVAHVGILLLMALVKLVSGNGAVSLQWLLCAVLVGIIGFGTCLGGASLSELYASPTHF